MNYDRTGRRSFARKKIAFGSDADAVPDTSEASKAKSAQALKELGGEDAFYRKQGKGE